MFNKRFFLICGVLLLSIFISIESSPVMTIQAVDFNSKYTVYENTPNTVFGFDPNICNAGDSQLIASCPQIIVSQSNGFTNCKFQKGYWPSVSFVLSSKTCAYPGTVEYFKFGTVPAGEYNGTISIPSNASNSPTLAAIHVTVNPAAKPGKVTLITPSSPANNAKNVNPNSVLLQCQKSANPNVIIDNYGFMISTSVSFQTDTQTIEQTSNETNRLNLDPGKTYYWRACAANEVGQGAWSTTWSFTTAASSAILQSNIISEMRSSYNITILHGALYLKTTVAGDFMISIINLRGDCLVKKSFQAFSVGMHSIPVGNLSSGAYNVKITHKNDSKSFIVVIHR